jgi:hypothetical protein
MLIEVYNVTEQPNFKNIMLLNSLFVEANQNCYSKQPNPDEPEPNGLKKLD